ncbi:MAG: pentapeptide repeat-containing protein, partial [Cyanobacteria bacterium J06629_18]
GSDFSYADLGLTTLHDSYMAEVNLTGANLSGAFMEQTGLVRANLTGCRFRRARFMDVGWDEAIFCDTVMPDGSVRNDSC